MPHAVAVLAHGRHDDVAPRGGFEAAVAPGDLEAGREPLHVPLPWTRQGLVEIVDVEDHLPLGRAEQAEVRQVRIAAELHRQAGTRGRGEVGGHDERGAAKERERADQHAPVADGHELGHADLVLALQQRDRVGPV